MAIDGNNLILENSEGGITPIRTISTGPFHIYASSGAIILENVPKDAKVEVYNLQGERIYAACRDAMHCVSTYQIKVQTKGIYIVKVRLGNSTSEIFKLPVR